MARPAVSVLRTRQRTPLASEWFLFAALVVFSVLPFLVMLRHSMTANVSISGADAAFAEDDFQYMSWVREFGHDLLAGNLLDLTPPSRVFLHPMLLLSGWSLHLGLSSQLAFQLWKPVATVLLFLGFRAYARRFLDERWPQWVATAIGLFFATPAAAIFAWASIGSARDLLDFQNAIGELLPAQLLWGYLPSAISVALMPFFLLWAERLVDEPNHRRVALVSACGAAVAWLHPWQGETLLVLLAGVFLLGRLGRRYFALTIPTLATAIPVAYYVVLSKTDSAWDQAASLNARWGHLQIWAIALCLLPLALPAVLAVRGPSADLGERMLRLWPVAGLVVYVALSPSFPQHALEGLSLPLGILAVRGLASVNHRAMFAGGLAALAILPGTLWILNWMRGQIHEVGQPYYLTHDENRALDFLETYRASGGVLAGGRLGPVIPATTDRQTWVGHFSWTKDFEKRRAEADGLLQGRISARRGDAIVESSGARFVLADCTDPRSTLAALHGSLTPVRRFGCAGVYRVRARP